MTPEVRVSEFAARKIAAEFGPERSAAGKPSEWDFWSGPLAAALLGFRDFENLLWHPRPEIRVTPLVAPVVGALVFIGVLIDPDTIEIADFAVDPDYWSTREGPDRD